MHRSKQSFAKHAEETISTRRPVKILRRGDHIHFSRGPISDPSVTIGKITLAAKIAQKTCLKNQ